MTSELYQKGMAEMRRHLGPAADAWVKSIREIAPEFAKVNVEFPFGELYTREVLDDKTRELCTVAALTVQGKITLVSAQDVPFWPLSQISESGI